MKTRVKGIAIFDRIFKNYIQTFKANEARANATVFGRFFKRINCWNQDQQSFQEAEKFYADFSNKFQHPTMRWTDSTEKLLYFTMDYPLEKPEVKKLLWQAIRETAGFQPKHVRYLAKAWSKTLGPEAVCRQYHRPALLIFTPMDKPLQNKAKKYINEAIKGNYPDDLIKCLNNYMGFTENHYPNDFGQRLLNHLDAKINQLKQGNANEKRPRSRTNN